MAEGTQAALEARNVSRAYGSVQAVRQVSISLDPGQITALVGDNGAGKSTLLKMLCGVLQPDEGELWMDGARVTFRDPLAARDKGIETVFQDLALVEALSATENTFLGSELRTLLGKVPIPWIDRQTMNRETRKALDNLGITTLQDVNTAVESLSGGQRQSLAVARGVRAHSRVALLDEPTAALGVYQTSQVLAAMSRKRDEGAAVLFISTDLADVFEIADRIIVMRLGEIVARYDKASTTEEEVVSAIMGR
jgi:ABC-type sugar transport system ATPase subunit